ncbi:MAG TPA: alpha/beta hydrolase [Candidatus Limnocylindria bacterium]|nr:alpha/beta hydrolase [Candidatus Limnocylindria bacterium]
MRKIRRGAPYLALAAFVLALLAYGAVSYRVADGVTKLERRPLVPAASTVSALHEDVSFRATDGLLLKGWWFPPAGVARGGPPGPGPGKAVVFVHGRGQNRIASSFRPDRIAPLFLERGWHVLLFDLRGHGESDGERYSLGQYEPRDIVAAIDFAATKANIPRQRVAVIGESLGAGSAIMTVGLDPTIGPVVTDSAYADGYTVVSEVGTNYTGLPSWFTPGIVLASRVFFGLDVASVRPAEVVRRDPRRAWLFIQCADDQTVFAHHGTDLRAASANPETELWMAPGCDHVKAFTEHPAEWQRRVFAFLDRELARAGGAASR